MITTNTIKIRVTLLEPMLGSTPNNEAIHTEYIASKGPNAETLAEEVAAAGAAAVEEKGMTVFPRTDDDEPFMWDYQLRGFLKENFGILREIPGSACCGMANYKKVVDNYIAVYPRKVLLQLPDGEDIGDCQRPLRAQTMQGERVALAHSEEAPAGTVIEFTVEYMVNKIGKKNPVVLKECIMDALDYGSRKGLGQWRNSGKGRFTYQIIEEGTSDLAVF